MVTEITESKWENKLYVYEKIFRTFNTILKLRFKINLIK